MARGPQVADHCYRACCKHGCRKNVVESADQQWHCPECDTIGGYEWKYSLSMMVHDERRYIWCKAFDESEVLLDIGNSLSRENRRKSHVWHQKCWPHFNMKTRNLRASLHSSERAKIHNEISAEKLQIHGEMLFAVDLKINHAIILV